MADGAQKGAPQPGAISDLLALIQTLTTRVIRAESVDDLLAHGFRTLFDVVPFDVGLAVSLDQNLDLHIMTRAGSESSVSDQLIDKIREALGSVTTVSFASTDVIVRRELHDLPAGPGGDALAHETGAPLEEGGRMSGMVLLYRREPEFSLEQTQITEIFAAQMSMLIGNLRARNQILNLADTDDLTGIWNKRYFRRQLPYEMERARVYGVPLSLLLFDVDDFKSINDTFGHTIGDVVLSELCGAVMETLRPPDAFARFGGDEFAIILPHTDLTGARAVADRILDRVRMMTVPADEQSVVRTAVSIGVTESAPDDTMKSLVHRADERLYDAKRLGKDRCSWEPSDRES
jgi:diguanylate cyclase (GGDEF)-like protein